MNLDVTSEEYKLYFEIVMKIADNFEAEESDKIILKLGDLLEKVSRVELPVKPANGDIAIDILSEKEKYYKKLLKERVRLILAGENNELNGRNY
jgi:hypothetical protein